MSKTYEEKVLGSLPEHQYELLSHQYEEEYNALEEEIAGLKEKIDTHKDGIANAEAFIDLINKYEDFDHMDTLMCREFVEKILVHEKERKGSWQSPQRVDIYFNFIGCYVPPAEPIDPEVAAEQEAERLKIEARKDRLHENYLRRKANGTQKKYEEKYKPKHEAWKAKRIAEMPPSNGITLAEIRAQKGNK